MAVARTFRISVSTTKQTKTLPEHIKFSILKNSGTDDILFNFDDETTNYFSLAPGEKVGPIHITSGQKINLKTLTGSSNLEVIAWG